MRRLLAVLVPLALLAACGGDDDAGDPPATTVGGDTDATPGTGPADAGDDPAEDHGAPPETTVPETGVRADAPADTAPDGGDEDGEDGEGLGDALLVTDLDGASEVPGPGHPAATGRFEAELHDGVLCVDMLVEGLGVPVTGAHLHEGAVGEAGGVIVDIGVPATAAADPARWDDACTEVDDEVIERIAGSPERVYVNVHTGAHPDGAVRGQLAVASVFDRTLGER